MGFYPTWGKIDGNIRQLFAENENERNQWLKRMQRAAEVIPFENDYTLGRLLGIIL